MSLIGTFRDAWADEDLRRRMMFVLMVFVIYAAGIHIPVPVPGRAPEEMISLLGDNSFFALLNMMGGGAFKRLSILALGLGPYITASIIMQVMSQGNPKWKAELQEGGEYARKQQNKRTRVLTLFLCFFQSFTLLRMIGPVALGPSGSSVGGQLMIALFWTAGAMILLWLGEQISEKGIGNGVSLLIFAGIVISFPGVVAQVMSNVPTNIAYWQVGLILLVFLATTWAIVYFTVAQRRIPIQHMRRQFGTKTMGGQTSYLPISVNMAGVIPVIFAIALIYMPSQLAAMFPQQTQAHQILTQIAMFFNPDFTRWQGILGALIYALMIFGFTYLWNAMMYNVEDIANNLKRGGSYIPGVRPGKQTIDFLNQVISRVTFVGAVFLAFVALTQFIFPILASGATIPALGLLGGTSVLIMVSVALETMRQIEAHLITKQYGG